MTMRTGHAPAASPLPTVCVEGRNSLDFLEEVFGLYEAGRLFCIVRGEFDPADWPELAITERRATGGRTGWARFRHQPGTSAAPAQIVFTSGTEGRPKAVLLSHGNLGDVVRRLNDAMQVTPEIREYIGVPVTYSFGLGRARAVAAAGGELFLPERFDPGEIRDLLAEGRVNAISAVPSLWRLILANPGVIGPLGERVRWIEIGSQYMPRAEKEAMRQLFPNARILQHYGLTEASRTTFLDISATSGEALESVGVPVGAVETRIGADSEICIRGPQVALGILAAEGLRPIVDAEGWLHTSDRGEIRDGRLCYLGRLDDQINVAGVKLAAEALEREVVALLPAAQDFALAPIPDPLRGEAILLALGPGAGGLGDLIEAAVQTVLRRRGIHQPDVLQAMEVAALPVTGTGKVRRQELRRLWQESPAAARQASGSASGAAPEADPDLTGIEARIAEIWSSSSKPPQGAPHRAHRIGRDTTFYDLGADSLSSLQLGLTMEGEFSRAAVRAVLQGQPLGRVAAIETAERAGAEAGRGPDPLHDGPVVLPAVTRKAWALNAARGIMVISVLMSHWAPAIFNRLGLRDVSEAALAFFYRMGTPGFALVFGLGLGFSMLPAFATQPDSVHKRLRLSLILVGCGMCLIAAVRLTLWSLDPGSGGLSGLKLAQGFYNVLAFYTLALLAMPLVLRLLSRSRHQMTAILAAAALFWGLWHATDAIFDQQVRSLLEWPRLMMIANYSVFRVGAFVFLGMAAGLWLSRQTETRPAALTLLGAGAAGLYAAIATGIEDRGLSAFAYRNSPFYSSFDGAIFYASLVLLVLGGMLLLMERWAALGRGARLPLQGLILTGSLAMPIYAAQEVVIPIKAILHRLGLIEPLAIALPIGGFGLLLVYGFRRIGRVYFG